ncbi:MAG: class I SAM-dependent methyltransferase [Microthrixaceae bacterium]
MAYAADLARIYDLAYAGMGKDYAAEARLVRRLVARAGSAVPSATAPRSLLDVACGTGTHLAEFAQLGYRISGMDLSEPMLAIARGRLGAEVPLVAGSFEALPGGVTELAPFDLVTCLFSSIAYVSSTESLRRVLGELAALVAPGGALVVEPWIPREGWLVGHVGHDTVTQGDTTVMRMAHSGIDGDRATIHFEYLVGEPDGIWGFSEDHRMLMAPVAVYVDALADAGLEVEFDADGFDFGFVRRGLVVGARVREGS